jgi:lipopolysaccharide transport system permease protein
MRSRRGSHRFDQVGYRKTPFLFGPFGPLVLHWRLIAYLVWTEIRATYARSMLGLFWIVLLPIFYVSVFVFIRVYLVGRNARTPDWLGATLGIGDLEMISLMIFAGFIVFWQASDILNRSPAAVRQRAEFVRDSVFPVEVLPWVTIGVAAFNMVVRAGIFLVAFGFIVGYFQVTALLYPIVIAPMVLMFIGVGYAFAAIGVYFRDLDFILTALTTGLIMLSAVLFPLSEVPEAYRPYAVLNPMAMAIEQTRLVVLLGRAPDWGYLGPAALVGVAMTWAGFALFRKLRGGFADVV